MSDGLLDDNRFYKLEKTCRVCKRTERMSVWNRQAVERGASLVMERQGKQSTFLCPKCASAGKQL